jgi:hypothetical protein
VEYVSNRKGLRGLVGVATPWCASSCLGTLGRARTYDKRIKNPAWSAARTAVSPSCHRYLRRNAPAFSGRCKSLISKGAKEHRGAMCGPQVWATWDQRIDVSRSRTRPQISSPARAQGSAAAGDARFLRRSEVRSRAEVRHRGGVCAECSRRGLDGPRRARAVAGSACPSGESQGPVWSGSMGPLPGRAPQNQRLSPTFFPVLQEDTHA